MKLFVRASDLFFINFDHDEKKSDDDDDAISK